MSDTEHTETEWLISHFSLANPKGSEMGDVPRLLERLAETLRSLGTVQIQDITFHAELTDEGVYWPAFTVYFNAAVRQPNEDPPPLAV